MKAFYLFLAFALLWYFLFRENFLTHTYGISTGTTRNMSYDLRGDVPIPGGCGQMVSPWNNSTLCPIQNRPMTIGGQTIGQVFNPYEYYEPFSAPPNNSGRMPTHFYDNYYYDQYWNPQFGVLS